MEKKRIAPHTTKQKQKKTKINKQTKKKATTVGSITVLESVWLGKSDFCVVRILMRS